jgi:hypothetical protein
MERMQKVEIGRVVFELELNIARLNVHVDHLLPGETRSQFFRQVNYMTISVMEMRKLLEREAITDTP